LPSCDVSTARKSSGKQPASPHRPILFRHFFTHHPSQCRTADCKTNLNFRIHKKTSKKVRPRQKRKQWTTELISLPRASFIQHSMDLSRKLFAVSRVLQQGRPISQRPRAHHTHGHTCISPHFFLTHTHTFPQLNPL